MKPIVIIAALLVACGIGYQLGRPHQDTKAQRDAIHAHLYTACGEPYLKPYPDYLSLEEINRHDDPIWNCRSAEDERYLGLPEGSTGRLPTY